MVAPRRVPLDHLFLMICWVSPFWASSHVLRPPPRYLRVGRSLLFHLWIGVFLATDLSHINLIISVKPSLCSHPSSNLVYTKKKFKFGRTSTLWRCPVVSKTGAWPEKLLCEVGLVPRLEELKFPIWVHQYPVKFLVSRLWESIIPSKLSPDHWNLP
jgi:hypothetical protein